jgi:hypothetical protein
MSIKLKKTLFRSFLRWNRHPAIVSSNFLVDPNDIGIGHLLPQSVRSIRNKEGIHGAISYCFRTAPAVGEKEVDMDLAFDVLKKLNTYGTELKRRYSQHIKNSAPDVYNKVILHIGQAVHHKPSNCRCVVTGWEIDMETGQQLVECIADQADVEEIVRVRDSYPGMYVLVMVESSIYACALPIILSDQIV